MKRLWLITLAFGLLFINQPADADWTTPRRLTWTSGHSILGAIAREPAPFLSLVWSDDTSGKGEIYFKKSTDGGTTWNRARRLTWNAGWSGSAAIAVVKKTVHVAWQDETRGNYEIFYKRSTDAGESWGATRRLTWNSGGSYGPAIGCGHDQNIYLAWSDATPGNCEIYCRHSSDAGDTWSSATRLTWNDDWSGSLSMHVDAAGQYWDIVHIAWYDYTLGNAEIFYRKRSLFGWLQAKRLTTTSGSSYYPDLVHDDENNVHIVWADETPGDWEIYYAQSTDEGGTWTKGERISKTSGDAGTPSIDLGSTASCHVVWNDDTPGNDEIYYATNAAGSAWMKPQRLTWNSSHSTGAEIIAASDNTLHVFWVDDAPGNFSIYYKKFTE